MKSFEKFRSRALNSNTLKEIKGGVAGLDRCDEISEHCAQIAWMCSGYCDDPLGLGPWYDCIMGYDINCSPLQGYDHVCNYRCPPKN